MRIHAAALALTAALVPFPAYAQDPPTAPPDAQAQDAGGGRGGRAPEPQMRPYDRVITKEAKSDRASSPSIGSRIGSSTRFPRTNSGKSSLGQPDRQDDDRCRIRRAGGRQSRREVGAERGSHPAPRRVLRGRGRRLDADLARRSRRRTTTPSSWLSTSRRIGKDDAPVIEVTRLFTTDVPEFSARTRVRARTFDTSRSFIERAVSFPENIEVEATHTYNNPPDAPAAGGGPAPAPGGRGAAPRAYRQRQCGDALQHGEAAREADDAAALRRARRLLLRQPDGLRQGRAARAGAALHHAVASGEEGSERGDLRADQADRLLDRSGHAGEVGAVLEEAGSRAGSRRSRQPDSRTRSSRRRRRLPNRIPTGARRTRATR